MTQIESENFGEKTKLIWTKPSKPLVMLWLDNNTLILGCDDGKIVLRNINDIEGISDIEYKIHDGPIKSLVWNKSYTQILTGSQDCTSKQIDITTWTVKSTYKSNVPINCACWNHNDRKVLVGGGIEAMNVAKTLNNDLNLKIFRVSDQKIINHIGSHFGPIRYIDRSPCSKNFISASQDGTVKIYFVKDDITNNKEEQHDLDKEPIIFNNFGSFTDSNKVLSNETNKIINLNWKPSKVKIEKVVNWIPGMPKPINDNLYGGSLYQVNNNDSEFSSKYELATEIENSTIRVTNLPKDTRPKELLDLFDLFGRIEERGGIRIKEYDFGSTIAFIKYIHHDSALKAIDKMDGLPLEHNIIKVELARPRKFD